MVRFFMIFLAFLAILQVNQLFFEMAKEIELKDDLVLKPFYYDNSLYLFYEGKIEKLKLGNFQIDPFFESSKYSVFRDGIHLEENMRKVILFYDGERLKLNSKEHIKNFFKEGSTLFLNYGTKVTLYDMDKNRELVNLNPESRVLFFFLDENTLFLWTENKLLMFDRKGNFINSFSLNLLPKKCFWDKDYLYLETENDYLQCIRKRDLRKIWEIRVPSEVMNLKVRNKRIFLLCGANILLCLKRTGGDILWWKNTHDRCFPEMEFFQEHLMIFQRSGILFFNTNNGTIVKKLEIPMSFSPIFLNGSIFAFTTKKIQVYKVKK